MLLCCLRWVEGRKPSLQSPSPHQTYWKAVHALSPSDLSPPPAPEGSEQSVKRLHLWEPSLSELLGLDRVAQSLAFEKSVFPWKLVKSRFLKREVRGRNFRSLQAEWLGGGTRGQESPPPPKKNPRTCRELPALPSLPGQPPGLETRGGSRAGQDVQPHSPSGFPSCVWLPQSPAANQLGSKRP